MHDSMITPGGILWEVDAHDVQIPVPCEDLIVFDRAKFYMIA